jgi:putative photosynthetic complex assembly protein 2
MGVTVVMLTWDQPNQTGTWTFLVLWAMRLSAKLNLFLGVRNRGEEFLPEKMRYLDSFFGRRPANLLFPVVISVSTGLAAVLWWEAVVPGTTAFSVAALSLTAALLSLAILEHWFMVLPLSSTALWRWAMRNRAGANADSRPAQQAPRAALDLTPLPLKPAD